MDDNLTVKLKSLKVVDLKAILAQANVQVPAKANKNDLIARIIGSTKAVDVYNKLHSPQDDLLAPPEDVDWNSDQASPEPKSPVLTKSDDPPAAEPDPTPAALAPTSNTAPVHDDPEAEKRRQRAARFGIPVIEPPKPRPPHAARNTSARNGTKQPPSSSATTDDAEKLKARAARFGAPQPAAAGQKRSAPTENIDPEEAERRRKRAERFGTSDVETTKI